MKWLALGARSASLQVLASAALACPTCKNALEDPAAHKMAVGFNTSSTLR